MDLNRDPSKIAFAAADELRSLNHRTLDPDAFTQPGDVSDVANGLASLVERLPQALQQASVGLRRLEGQQAIRMDDGTDAGRQVGAVLRALLNAQEALRAASGALRAATGPLSHMGGLWPEDEPESVADAFVAAVASGDAAAASRIAHMPVQIVGDAKPKDGQ